MSKFSASLCLYIISSILIFIAVLLDNEILAFITKPILIPSIVFYYFSKLKRKASDLFVISFVLFFIVDMLYLINLEDYYHFGLLVFLFPYLIIIYFVFNDLSALLKTRVIRKIDISLYVVVSLLIYLFFSLLNLLQFETKKEFIYVLIIGLELFVMTVLTALVFLYSSYKKNAYLVFATVSFILSDIFFMLAMQFLDIFVLKLVNALAQSASYFFYVSYFLERNKVRGLKQSLT